MKELGFIGCGSMGSMLVNGFLRSKQLDPRSVVLSNRTLSKTRNIKQSWPGIEIADINTAVAEKCDRIILCVKPGEVKPVLDEIRMQLREKRHIISIAACVTIADIESVHPGKVTKVIPSITSEVNEGISLVCHNGKVEAADAAYVEKLFSAISSVKTVCENDFEAAADLTSCAPGFVAAIFQEFVEAGLRHSSLIRSEAEEMVVKTLFGTAKLLIAKDMNFKETIKRVATKGGITEEGVRVIQNRLPMIFDEIFKSTLGKHDIKKAEIGKQFRGN